jgi:hypothetical protein
MRGGGAFFGRGDCHLRHASGGPHEKRQCGAYYPVQHGRTLSDAALAINFSVSAPNVHTVSLVRQELPTKRYGEPCRAELQMGKNILPSISRFLRSGSKKTPKTARSASCGKQVAGAGEAPTSNIPYPKDTWDS